MKFHRQFPLGLLPCSCLTLAGLAQAPTQFGLEAPQPISGLNLERMVAADVDGDGDLDLLGTARVFINIDAVYLLRNDGNGRFVNVTTQQMPGFLQNVYSVTPFDCDGDGDVDLFLHGNQHGLLLRNNGTGTFVVSSQVNVASVGGAAGDLDGDGDVDLAIAGQLLVGGQSQLLINDGTGGLSPGPFFTTSYLGLVALLDLEPDGDLDIFYASTRQLLRNNGGLSFTDVSATQLLVSGTAPISAMVQGDLDGDGDGDFVCQGAGEFTLLHQGNALVQGLSFPAQPQRWAWALADFDRDGDLDLLRAGNTGQWTLACNDGVGNFTFTPGRLPPMPIYSQFLHAADFDGDGDADLLTCLPGSATLLLRNRHVHLDVGQALRGQNWNVELWSEPGYAIADGVGVLAVSLARLPAPLPLPPFGNLWLDLNGALLVADSIPMSAGRRAFTFAIPSAPQLVGVELSVQGLVAAASGAVLLTALGIAAIQ